jgi:hypothetical protein
MHNLATQLSQLEAPAPDHFRNLSLFPLLSQGPLPTQPEYLLLDQAILEGLGRVTETGGGGSVPELRFENNADRAVLLLDGEELLGAKQNRVLNLTILAPPRQVMVIPVSCVEAGRWSMRGPEFRPSPAVMYSKVRASRAARVTDSMLATGARRSDQGAVWADIDAKACRMDADSPTQAMSALYERHALSVEEYVRAFTCHHRQVGVVFAMDDLTMGLDLFDHPETFRRYFPRLLRSYALDALDQPRSQSPPATSARLEDFLQQVGTATLAVQPALGLGKDVRITGHHVSGGALWFTDRYVHACAFLLEDHGVSAPHRPRMARPSLRRSGSGV